MDIKMANSRAILKEFTKEFHQEFNKGNGSENIESLLADVLCLVSTSKEATRKSSKFQHANLREVRTIFIQDYLEQVLDTIISNLNVDLVKSLSSDGKKTLNDIFLNGSDRHSLCSLCFSITESNTGYKVNKCCDLLEEFIQQQGISRLLIKECVDVDKSINTIDSQQINEQISTCIVSIPERVTNKLRSDTSEIFYPKKYVPLVVNNFNWCVIQVREGLKNGRDCSLGCLSLLLGKLCLSGHGDITWKLLLQEWIPLIRKDVLWQRLLNQLILGLPDRHTEATIVPFLRHCPWYGNVKVFLGHGALDNRKLQFLLTTKLLLMRHTADDNTPQNILGYLASLDILRPLFVSTVKRLLKVWGDGSAIKHSSYEQHLYISKCLVICTAFIRQKDSLVEEMKDFMLPLLMPGVQQHLDSSVEKTRRLGMIVAEQVTLTANLSPDNTLKFDYVKDEETELLESLATIPEDPGIQEIQLSLSKELSLHSTDQEPVVTTAGSEKVSLVDVDSELDSDDDLEPYDMSHDVKTRAVKPPMYVRECMEGVINNEDPEKVEVALEHAGKLVRAHPSNAREIAVEFTKVLIHLDDKYNLPGFFGMRHNAMVALCFVDPKPVALFLSEQFYERNYNIRQRLDMLEVLASAAQEISGLKAMTESDQGSASKISVIDDKKSSESEEGDTEDWRAIVQKRIDSKTRIISRGRTRPEPKVITNKFADIAGHFFFPLLAKFDQAADRTFDLMGDDHHLLSRLFYTLGVIIYSASHCNIVRQMSKALVEFIWMARFHPQQGVRHSILFSLSMLTLATPAHILLTDLQREVSEIRLWLEHTANKDESQECKKMAVQVLVLLEQSIKMELENQQK